MPGEKKQYEICKEAQQIIERLCSLYPNKFGHIDPSTVGCVMITNKEKSETQDDCKIRGVKEPDSIFCSKRYIIEFYKTNVWDLYDAGQRSGMLYKQLERIPDKDEGPDGSVEKLSLQDSRTLVANYGVDYMDGKLPDLAAEKVDGLDS